MTVAAFPSRGLATRGLKTGFADKLFSSTDSGSRALWLGRAKGANTEMVRIFFDWRAHTSGQPSNPRDPGSPEYAFSTLDDAVGDATDRGLDPLIVITRAPAFAEGPNRPNSAAAGAWKPDPSAVGDYMAAVAKRYSGSYGGLPRVRFFQLFNEVNLDIYLAPQWNKKKLVAASHYRRMLDAAYEGIHGVNSKARLVTAGLAPYGENPGGSRSRPLRFWREALCLKGRKKLAKKKCSGPKASFDIFAHHAINTSGPPRQSAINPDDASSGDLPAVVRIFRAAERKNRTAGPKRHPFWVTELWWESNPPDKEQGVKLARQARYYEETMYLAWKAKASAAIALQIRDAPNSDPFARQQTGIYFANGKPKPALRAFRLSFVANRAKGRRVQLWGKAARRGSIAIERKRGKKWRKVRTLKAGSNGIFAGRTSIRGKAKLRARLGNTKSLTWSIGK